MNNKYVIYLSYDGALDPLGRSQIIPIVEGLAKKGQHLILLTFEKSNQWSDVQTRNAMHKRLESSDIKWMPHRYHKRISLIATSWDLFRATLLIYWLVLRKQIKLIHARSYPPTLVAWVIYKIAGIPYIFDMRGFYPEERVDGGLWTKEGNTYRVVKWLEKRFIRDARSVVTLTNASVPILEAIELEQGGPKPIVIPTTVNLDLFSMRSKIPPIPTLAYFGSLGTWYMLDEMLEFGKAFLENIDNSKLLFLVNEGLGSSISNEKQAVLKCAKVHGILSDQIEVTSAIYEDIPKYLEQVTATYVFIRPAPSKKASAATKISESFALGIPVAVNSGIGDSATIIESNEVGVVVDPFDSTSFANAAMKLFHLGSSNIVTKRCREVAVSEHSLSNAINRYNDIYNSATSDTTNSNLKRKRIIVICPYPVGHVPGQRLKFEQYLQSWRNDGFDVKVQAFWGESSYRILYENGNFLYKIIGAIKGIIKRIFGLYSIKKANLVYLFQEAVPFGPPVFEELIHKSGIPIVYELDDLIFKPYSSSANPFMYRLRSIWGPKKIEKIITISKQVIVSNNYLKTYAKQYSSNVTVIGPTVDMKKYQAIKRTSNSKEVVVGWSGSPSTAHYLLYLTDVLRELQRTENIIVRVLGAPKLQIPGVNIDVREWSSETEIIELSSMDIGLYPLRDERFASNGTYSESSGNLQPRLADQWAMGKTGGKVIQYMACGIPVVAQRIGNNLNLIDDGQNGFLASTTDEWISILRQLIHDPNLRKKIGENGRNMVNERYSVEANESQYLDILKTSFNI